MNIVKNLKKVYEWVILWAYTPYATIALFILAFVEASFFPVPPDILLIVLCISKNHKAFKYAIICTLGSVLGGIFGFYIGIKFWNIAETIIYNYVTPQTIEKVRDYFIKYQAWAVAIAGFTPIPYKVFTILAGFFRVNFSIFVIASLISRGARFFIIAGLIYLFGEKIRYFIEKYFNIITYLIFGIILIAALIFGLL